MGLNPAEFDSLALRMTNTYTICIDCGKAFDEEEECVDCEEGRVDPLYPDFL